MLSAMPSLLRFHTALPPLLAVGLLALSLAGCEPPPPPSGSSLPPQSSATAAASSSASSEVEPAGARSAKKEADSAIVIGERQTFSSTILGEDRTIFVYTPPGYKTSGAAYPVLYLLDGETNFHHTTGLVDFLSSRQRAPEMIVVGVTNTVRDRDLTPTAIKDRPASGGGAKFLSFLKDELGRRIEGAYRTVPYRILVGHSLGGLFSVYALTSAPDAFNAYVSISPSLWWDDELMRRNAEELFAKRPDLQAFLYISVGNEPGRMLDGNKAFAAMLKAKAPKGIVWDFKHMEREDHGSIVHRTTYDALEALFTGYQLPPGVDDVKALKAHYESLSKRFHFEVKPPEVAVNLFGYGLMEKRREEAIAAFELNVKLYPGSANVYDSLGEAYEKSGKLDLAKVNYEKAVRMATESADPLLPAFKQNLERVSKSASK
jgi:predicted alpha/beta superfamily hydrolase